MMKYVISDINADGYERFVTIKNKDNNLSFVVHFLEYDEYLEDNEKSKKRDVGDIMEGEMAIGLVAVDKEVNATLMHKQLIPGSSHIEAIVRICKIVDDYSVFASSSLVNGLILIEFEHRVNYRKGDVIYLEGSLEMNL